MDRDYSQYCEIRHDISEPKTVFGDLILPWLGMLKMPIFSIVVCPSENYTNLFFLRRPPAFAFLFKAAGNAACDLGDSGDGRDSVDFFLEQALKFGMSPL